jgi:hypothetical protein
VFGAVEIFLVSFLFDTGQLETLVLLPLFFYCCLLAGGRRVVFFVVFVQIVTTAISSSRGVSVFLIGAIGVILLVTFLDFMVRLAFVPYRVGGDFLSRTFYPITRSRYEVVGEFFAEFICNDNNGMKICQSCSNESTPSKTNGNN